MIRFFEVIGLASEVGVAPPSKLRDGYVDEGVLTSVLAEWILLAAVLTTPWWSGSLLTRLHALGRDPDDTRQPRMAHAASNRNEKTNRQSEVGDDP